MTGPAERIVQDYFERMAEIRSTGAATSETSYYGAFEPGFPRWIASLMTFLGDSAIRINAIPSSRRVKPVSPCG